MVAGRYGHAGAVLLFGGTSAVACLCRTGPGAVSMTGAASAPQEPSGWCRFHNEHPAPEAVIEVVMADAAVAGCLRAEQARAIREVLEWAQAAAGGRHRSHSITSEPESVPPDHQD